MTDIEQLKQQINNVCKELENNKKIEDNRIEIMVVNQCLACFLKGNGFVRGYYPIAEDGPEILGYFEVDKPEAENINGAKVIIDVTLDENTFLFKRYGSNKLEMKKLNGKQL